MTDATSFTERAFQAVADTQQDGGLARRQKDVEAGNFFRHAVSLALTKTADGLIDPKLVLSWLLTTLGAPSVWIGLLVPVREAGALFPQLFTAPLIMSMQRRKWAWAAGSAVQGLAAGGIVVAGLTLEGQAAGMVIVALLAVLALARSICSVSYKDILGKTIGKSRRGTTTGFASSLSSAAVVIFALILLTGVADRFVLVVGAIALASAFWLVASAIFATLNETSSDVRPVEAPIRGALSQLALLRDAPDLRRFILARGLLTGTALAPPFLVLLASQSGQEAFQQLGALVLASALAAFLSSYVWGRLADTSSRRVLIWSGLSAAVALTFAVLFALFGLMGSVWAAPIVLFGLMLAYNGVRQGRSTYLVDMAPEDQRSAYTAVSNTVIGLILLASGAFGAIASIAGAIWTVVLFALMSFAGAFAALRMEEVQGD